MDDVSRYFDDYFVKCSSGSFFGAKPIITNNPWYI